MGERLAFALGGGGARGALQVGALRALFEAALQPDLLVGTSAGAINATFLAQHGFTASSLDNLVAAWHDAETADLLPANYVWLTVRVLFNRARTYPSQRMRDFFIAHGLTPEIRFQDLPGPRLILVAADINHHCCVLYGEDPNQRVLEGLLASTALPPWVNPLEVDGNFLMDGGLVSNLPIEPALKQGATQIIALDVADPRIPPLVDYHFGAFMSNLVATVSQRQVELEKRLAKVRGVMVRHIQLTPELPIAVWDFSHTDELIARGYEKAVAEIASWHPRKRSWWQRWFSR